MHPRLADLTDVLSERRAALLAAVAAVPADDLERRPTPDGWSVAEVVDHLARVEGGTARLLAKRVERARESGVGPDAGADPVRDRLAHLDVVGSPARREAPEAVRPRPGVSAESALAALRDSRDALLAMIRDAHDVDLSHVVATHAALGELDGYQWILFVAEHEARHARQIDVIREALAGRPEGAGDTTPG
jgi:hypothetical protein